MIKNMMKVLIMYVILISINLGLSHLINSHFIDLMFFVGLAVTLIIFLFNSSGGSTTGAAYVLINKTNKLLNSEGKQGFKYKVNIYFFASLIYTITGLIAGIYFYRSYY